MPPQLKHEDLLYKYYDVQPQEFDKIYNLLKDLESNNIRDFALNSKYERLFLAEDGNIMFNNRTHSTIPLILMSYIEFIKDNEYLNKSTSIAQRKTIKL